MSAGLEDLKSTPLRYQGEVRHVSMHNGAGVRSDQRAR